MRLRMIVIVSAFLVTGYSLAEAQPRPANFGTVLDSGGQKLSASDFRKDIVGYPIVGSTAANIDIEVVYVADGRILGQLFHSIRGGTSGGRATDSIAGTWTLDDAERICTTMQLGNTYLPARCEYWYKVGDQYFLSTSDSDREAKVAIRSLRR